MNKEIINQPTFGRIYCLHFPSSTLQMKAVGSSETLVNTSNITWRINPEDRHLNDWLLIYKFGITLQAKPSFLHQFENGQFHISTKKKQTQRICYTKFGMNIFSSWKNIYVQKHDVMFGFLNTWNLISLFFPYQVTRTLGSRVGIPLKACHVKWFEYPACLRFFKHMYKKDGLKSMKREPV
jgi:hypothetical protein